MTLSQAFQFSLLQRRVAPLYSPRLCRRIMRGWAKFWRERRGDKESFDIAELALGNALAWRDRASWPDYDLRRVVSNRPSWQSGRVMSTPETAGGSSEATSPPALF